MGLSKHRTRRFDGRPETSKDKRFFDLRESGYDGWIDQDGYAVTEERNEDGKPRFVRNGGSR